MLEVSIIKFVLLLTLLAIFFGLINLGFNLLKKLHDILTDYLSTLKTFK